ncbi:uncharacterized protein LOC126834299 [Adelges cooleyi]|uniref:uncharacterized protein LOC126834299 n=1 Tax=Adelges cooleyi TaxID=133065 RepID=UPI00218077B3|nr:uncharacterized protein LOC126834299 [Adelges cooleyi]
MSLHDFVTFHVRCEKSQFIMKIKTPENFSEFTEKTKLQLNADDNDIVILCPTTEGKMMEIQSDDDIEYLKKNKLCYNAVTKEIYCSVELVVIMVHKVEPQLPDDPKVQMMSLTKQVEKLSTQMTQLSETVAENYAELMNVLKSALMGNDNGQIEKNRNSSTSTDEIEYLAEPIATIPTTKTTANANDDAKTFEKPGVRQKKPMRKEKSQSTQLPSSTKTIHIPNDISGLMIPIKGTDSSNKQDKTSDGAKGDSDLDNPIKRLNEHGFTNTIQNIIVLKRFNNDFEKALQYLKTQA